MHSEDILVGLGGNSDLTVEEFIYIVQCVHISLFPSPDDVHLTSFPFLSIVAISRTYVTLPFLMFLSISRCYIHASHPTENDGQFDAQMLCCSCWCSRDAIILPPQVHAVPRGAQCEYRSVLAVKWLQLRPSSRFPGVPNPILRKVV